MKTIMFDDREMQLLTAIVIDKDKVSVVERLRNTGRIVTGFVQGFGLRSGAIACSYSWDLGSPLAVVGANDLDISTAVNRIVTLQGLRRARNWPVNHQT